MPPSQKNSRIQTPIECAKSQPNNHPTEKGGSYSSPLRIELYDTGQYLNWKSQFRSSSIVAMLGVLWARSKTFINSLQVGFIQRPRIRTMQKSTNAIAVYRMYIRSHAKHVKSNPTGMDQLKPQLPSFSTRFPSQMRF